VLEWAREGVHLEKHFFEQRQHACSGLHPRLIIGWWSGRTRLRSVTDRQTRCMSFAFAHSLQIIGHCRSAWSLDERSPRYRVTRVVTGAVCTTNASTSKSKE